MIIIAFIALIGIICVAEKQPEPVKATTKEIVEHERQNRRIYREAR
jgi:hypothetical protein